MLEDSDDDLYPYYDNVDSSTWRRSQRPDDSLTRSIHSAKQASRGVDKSTTAHDAPSVSEQTESLASYLKSLRKVVQNISSMRAYLEQEADVDPKMIQMILSGLSTAPLPPRVQELSKEYQSLLKTCLQTMETRKQCYLQQIKRMKENASVATRNAIQIERATTLQRLTAYEANQQTQHLQAINDLKSQLATALQQNQHQQEEIRRLELEHRTCQSEKTMIERHLDDLVRKAVHEQELQHAEELRTKEDKMKDLLVEMKEAKKEEAIQWEKRLQSQAQEIRLLEELKRQQMQQDLDRLLEEVQKTREDRAAQTDEITELHERHRKTMDSLRDRYEGILQQSAAEAAQAMATMREAHQTHLLAVEKERSKLRQDLENQMAKFREDMYRKQALEVETMRERLIAENKRKLTDQEVHYQEQIQKIKSLHEQELQRVLRDADRLRRTLQAQQVGSVAISTSAPRHPLGLSSSNSNNSSSAMGGYGSHSMFPSSSMAWGGGSSTSQGSTNLGLMRAQFTPSSRRAGSRASPVKDQGEEGHGDRAMDVPPPPGPPPDSTLLDEALFTASAKEPYSITVNTRRVSGYLKELEKYLHSQDAPPSATATATAVAGTAPSKTSAPSISTVKPFHTTALASALASESDQSDDSIQVALETTARDEQNSTLHSIGNAFHTSSNTSASTPLDGLEVDGERVGRLASREIRGGKHHQPHYDNDDDDDDDDDLLMDDFIFNISQASR